nr:hypothetical protein [Croceivirga thetidis]
MDSIIETLYDVISGEKGIERDWDLFKYLFHPKAKLIPSRQTDDGSMSLKFMSPKDYIKASGNWLVENGFFEKEIHREVDVFGNIAHVFSTYASFQKQNDSTPFIRGINSIQLLNDGERWWIVNIYWMNESEEHPIPQKYLPN